MNRRTDIVIFLLPLFLLLGNIGCRDEPVSPSKQIEEQGPSELVERLRWWSAHQANPYVFFMPGDFAGLPVPDDLISNIRWSSGEPIGQPLDSLVIDTTVAQWFLFEIEYKRIQIDVMKIRTTTSFEEIKTILSGCTIDYRVARYDSISIDLADRLLSWCNTYQNRKIIFVPHYVLVGEKYFAISCAYPIVYPYCIQNIAYLMRNMTVNDKLNLAKNINDSSTLEQMTVYLSVLGNIYIRDPFCGE